MNIDIILLPYYSVLIIILFVFLTLFPYRNNRMIFFFLLTLAFEFFGVIFYLLELTTSKIDVKLFWDSTQFISNSLYLVLIYLFVIQYTNRSTRFDGIILWIVIVVSLSVAIFAFAFPYSSYIRSNIALVDADNYSILTYDLGLFQYIWGIVLLFTPFYFEYILLNFILHAKERIYRKQATIFLIALAIPTFIGIFAMLGVHVNGQRDISPFSFGLANLIILYALMDTRSFDVVTVTRNELFKSSNFGICVFDEKQRLIDFNPVAIDLLGKALTKYSSYHDVFPDLDYLIQGLSDDLKKTLITYDYNENFYLELRILPILDQNDIESGFAVIVDDVTSKEEERHQLLEGTKKVNKENILLSTKIENIIQFSPTAYFEADTKAVLELLEELDSPLENHRNDDELFYKIYDQTKVVAYNETYQELMNLDDHQVQEGYGVLGRGHRLETYKQVMIDWYNGKSPIIYEMDLPSRNNQINWFLITIFQLPNEGRRLIVGSMQDITEIKIYQKELQEKQSQLYQLQKMESLGLVIGSVVHETKNSLFKISSYLDLIEYNPEEFYKYLPNIKEVLKNTADFIHNFLSFSRKSVSETQPVLVDKVVSAITNSLKPIIPRNVVINEIYSSQNAKICVSTTELELVLINLLLNACDAIREHGQISLETSILDTNHVLIRVIDTGIGMGEDTRNEIFTPFFTEKGEKGTGLGLYIVKEIVDKFQGEIEVVSEIGKGTEFMIKFPIIEV